jgi:hypothetical protein
MARIHALSDRSGVPLFNHRRRTTLKQTGKTERGHEMKPPKKDRVSAEQQFTQTERRPSKIKKKGKEKFCILDLIP